MHAFLIRKTLQINAKEDFEVEILAPPILLHLLEHRKR